MNTAQAVEHGRRWIAAGWTWKRGQVGLSEDDDGEWRSILVTGVAANGRPVCYGVVMPSSAVPDPRDDGTRGHMLGQVREAWGDPNLCTRASYNLRGELWWAVTSIDRENADMPPCGKGGTEAEALLAAREAAPGMKPARPG